LHRDDRVDRRRRRRYEGAVIDGLLAQDISALASGDWVAGFWVFCAMVIGHALADFPLQGEFLAAAKNRHYTSPNLPPEDQQLAIWVHCLTAHSFIHAGAVWIVTGSHLLAALEFGLHWIIDFIKCEGWTNFHADQILHLLCKVGFVVAIGLGWIAVG
jgi:hypothetical protein